MVQRDVCGEPERKRPEPTIGWATASASIAESITGNIASTLKARRMISTQKKTPVIGALKVAEMPPAERSPPA